MQRNSYKKKKDFIISLLMIVSILIVMIISVVRACKVVTVESAFALGGKADGSVMLQDSTYLEMEFSAPEMDINGFSFRFTGKPASLEDKKISVDISIRNDETNIITLYSEELLLSDQSYDYQNGNYIVIIPLNREMIHPYDHIRIAIMGVGITEQDNICISTSTQKGWEDVRFEVNDFEKKYVPVSSLYYNTTSRGGYKPLVQGLLAILLILIWGAECKKSDKEKTRNKQSFNWKKLFTRQRLLQFLIVMLLLAVGLEYTYFTAIKPRAELVAPIEETDDNAINDGYYITLLNGMSVMSEYTANGEELAGIGVYLKEPYDDRGILQIELRERYGGELVAAVNAAVYELENEKGYLQIKFASPIQSYEGMQYIISLSYEGTEEIAILANERNTDTFLTIGLYRYNTFLKNFYMYLVVAIFILSIIYFVYSVSCKNLEKLFIVTVVFLRILFGTVITPYAVPDETSHIDTIYRISNKMLGVEETGICDAIYRRECDTVVDTNRRRNLDIEQYRWLYDDLTEIDGIDTLKLSYACNNLYISNAIIYLPSAIGMTIGRLLGLGFFPIIFLARMFNFLISFWMIYCALRKIPVGKSIVCMLVLLPVSIQELASCSYDALTLAIALLFTAYSVSIIYKEAKISYEEILILLFAGLTLPLCKGGAYIPLYLLLSLVVTQNKFVKERKREILIIGIPLIAFIGITVFIKVIYPMLNYSTDPYILRNGTYRLGYLLQHLGETFRIIENTVYHNIDHYIQTIVGEGMGSLQVSVSFLTQVCYIGLLIASVISDERRTNVIKVKQKILFLVAAILSIGMFMAALLLYSTKFGIGEVSGVQGRYFLPILWLILICFRQGKIIYKKKPYRQLITAGYVLGICTVLQILIEVLRVA